jgi:hypothetical protein
VGLQTNEFVELLQNAFLLQEDGHLVVFRHGENFESICYALSEST